MPHEAIIRLGFFFGVLGTMGLWECIAPRRKLTLLKRRRWISHSLLVVIDTLSVRFLMPFTAIVFAKLTEQKGFGLFQHFSLPDGVRVCLSVIALDFVIYLQHVMFHALPILWRFHQIHHADQDFDVTTGVRFHPIEILISMGIKFGAIVLLGAPPLAVLIFEVVLNASAMFNHSNVKIPFLIDRYLRFLVVTPDMHRVHHSVVPHETDSNFGFNLPFWDRLCGTYCAQPKAGHVEMTIGLSEFREPEVAKLGWILLAPFTQ